MIGVPQPDINTNRDDVAKAASDLITARMPRAARNKCVEEAYTLWDQEFEAQQKSMAAAKPLTRLERLRRSFTRGSRASST